MPNTLGERDRERKLSQVRIATAAGLNYVEGRQRVRGEQMFVLAVLSAVSTDAAATKIVVFCVVCAWALSYQTTLIYAWRRSTNKMAMEVDKE